MPRFIDNGLNFIKYAIINSHEYMIIIPKEIWGTKDTNKICDHVSYWIQRKRKGKEPSLKYGSYEIVGDIDEDNSTYECIQCNKRFNSRSGYYKHRKSHSHNKIENQLQVSESSNTQVQNIRVPHTQNINTQNNNNNCTTNNIQINITPREFQKENPEWLTPEVFLDAIQNMTTAIPKLIKAKHFNDKFPENHNVRLGDRRDIKKRLHIFKDERWTIEDRSDVTTKLMYAVYDILDEIFNFFRGEGEAGFHLEADDELTETELHNRKVLESIRRSERAGRIISRMVTKWKNLAEKFGDKDNTLLEKINDRFDTILLDNELKITQLKEKIQNRM
jgi:hypothetical protein